MTPGNTFRWGIIGPGSIAEDFAGDLQYVGEPQQVTSVLSHKEESARKFAEKYDLKSVHTEISKFISERNFDAVYIASPHTAHYDQAMACLETGIPVLCEKPLVINAQQVRNLMQASEQYNAFLLEGLWIRFLPSIEKVLELIETNKIGKLVSVKASMSFKAPKDESNRYFNPKLGGGSLLDLGIYPVFLSHLLFGKPKRINATGKTSEQGIDETSAMLFGFEGGAYAMLESSIITQNELSAEISGDKGVIKILSPWNEKPSSILLQEYGKEEQHFPCEWEGRGFQFEVREVLRCLKEKKISSSLYCHQFSLDVMETLDRVRSQLGVNYHEAEKTV